MKAFWGTYTRIFNITNPDAKLPPAPFVYLASDSPEAADEFTESIVSNETLVKQYHQTNLYPFVYELRTSDDKELQSLAPAQEYVQSEWNKRSEDERIRETRGVVIDWALLAGVWQTLPDTEMYAVAPLMPLATIRTITCVSSFYDIIGTLLICLLDRTCVGFR